MEGRQRAAPYVRRWLREHGIKGSTLAVRLGLTWAQLGTRLRGEYPFSLLQALALAQLVRAPYAEVFPNHEGVDESDLRLWRLAGLRGPVEGASAGRPPLDQQPNARGAA